MEAVDAERLIHAEEHRAERSQIGITFFEHLERAVFEIGRSQAAECAGVLKLDIVGIEAAFERCCDSISFFYLSVY